MSDENDRIETVTDALHGRIDVSDFDQATRAPIRKIITSPFVQRLRRIKQLGFVSQNFLSAQHNRFAHALGTAHVMRKILARLEHLEEANVLRNALSCIQGEEYFEVFRKATTDDGRAMAILKQHLLTAAITQDVGELPYEKATSGVFSPGESIRSVVQASGISLSDLSPKHIYTLYFFWKTDHYDGYFSGLDRELLSFLVTGRLPGNTKKADYPAPLKALRQIVDGTIDADRIDYVYRDAFHTIGIQHSPDSLIDAIVDYGEHGPTLSHVRAATDFFVTRAALWSNVYLSPENRFRLILLRIALKELSKRRDASVHFYFEPQEVTEPWFLKLHDLYVDDLVQRVNDKSPDLPARAKQALTLLAGGRTEYDYRWLPHAEEGAPDWPGRIELPPDFYFDTYADYRDHTLYEQRSVSISGDRYSYIVGDGPHLEDCAGPFCRLLEKGDWPALPMPKHLTWFEPHPQKTDGAWGQLRRFRSASQLTAQLRHFDPLRGIDFQYDTRQEATFASPDIFVSFAWSNLEYAERVVGILLEEKRKFYILLNEFEGHGNSTVENSRRAVNDAGAILMLCSSQYAQRYRDDMSGNIRAEISRMEARYQEIPIVGITLDKYGDVEPLLPLKFLSPDGFSPFIGGPLRGCSSQEFRSAVLSSLAYIDKRSAKGTAP